MAKVEKASSIEKPPAAVRTDYCKRSELRPNDKLWMTVVEGSTHQTEGFPLFQMATIIATPNAEAGTLELREWALTPPMDRIDIEDLVIKYVQDELLPNDG